MARLEGIAWRAEARAPMQLREECEITLNAGVHSDTRGKPGPRQVTVLSMDTWQEVCAELGEDLPWTTRRANLLISGLRFCPGDVGRQIRIGEVVLEITGETTPCARMDAQREGLTGTLRPAWRGGVCCRVVHGGTIAVGAPVS